MPKGLPLLKIYAKESMRMERMRKGFNLTDFAELAGYTTSSMGKIENRRNGIAPNRTQRVLDILGMEFDDVFEFVTFEVED
jgi:transcriptional regulator with XRE-family HTH domain